MSKLSYRLVGEGQPIVFIHGLGGAKEQWDDQIDYFSNKYKCFSVSLQGHGGSSSGDYSIDAYTDQLEGLLKEQDIINPIIVANSMGGVIGLNLLKRRVKVKRLITNGTSPAITTSKLLVAFIKTMDTFLIKLLGYKRYVSIAVNAVLKGAEERNKLQTIMEMSLPEAIKTSHITLSNYSFLDHLTQLTVILNPRDKGINKTLLPLIETYKIDYITLNESNHVANMERPQAYNKCLEKILQTVSE